MHTTTKRLLSFILSFMVVMAFSFDASMMTSKAYAAEDGLTIETPALVVTGQGLIGNSGAYDKNNVSKEKSYTLDELKSFTEAEGKVVAQKYSAKNTSETKNYFKATGVKISALLGTEESAITDTVSVVATDNYAAIFNKDQAYTNNGNAKKAIAISNPRYFYDFTTGEKGEQVPAIIGWASVDTGLSSGQPSALPSGNPQELGFLRLFCGQYDGTGGGAEDMNNPLFNGKSGISVYKVQQGDKIDETVLTVGSTEYTRADILMMGFAERAYDYTNNKGDQHDVVRGVPFSVLLDGEDADSTVTFATADAWTGISDYTKTVQELIDGNYMLGYEVNGSGYYKADKNDATKYGFLALYGDGINPAAMVNKVTVKKGGGIDFSTSPYKHITNGGLSGQDGPYKIDAITGATLTIEGPGMATSTPLSVKDLETKNAGAYRGVYTDTRDGQQVKRTYEGIDVYYLLHHLSESNNSLTEKAYKVAFKNRNRKTVATLTLADIEAMHDAGHPAIVSYGTGFEDGTDPRPYVFNGATGESTDLGNGDGCLKLVYDNFGEGGNQRSGYEKFGNMAYIYVEEEETPGFKHNKAPYESAENSQYVLTVTGDEIGKEINYTVQQLEDMVEYDADKNVVDNGYGYRDEYSLANSSYWYVNTYEGVKLWSLLQHSGIDSSKANDEDIEVSFRSTDNYTNFDKFSLAEVSNPDLFGFYEKNAKDNNDGTYVPNENIRQGDDVDSGDKLKAGFPILVAYGTNYYPYVKSTSLDGYLSGLSNDGGPLRIISGKRNYGHANGSYQAKLLDKIVVGTNTHNYSTHFYNDESTTEGAAYKALENNELKIKINDGSGKDNTKTYTVADLEKLIYGGSLTKTELGEAKIKSFYETSKNGSFYSDLYEGVNLNFFLKEVVKLAGSQGTVTFKGADGTLEMSLEDVLATDNGYNATTELGGLSPVIAYAKNGYPLVAAKNDAGWVKNQTLYKLDGTEDTANAYTVQNQGGPLQLVFPRENAEATSTMGTMTGFTEIEINLEADKYAHVTSPYDTYADSTLTVSGEGTRVDGNKTFTVSELEGNQSLATTKTYSMKGQSGDPTQIRYRGLDLYKFLKSTNVGLKNNADKVKIYAEGVTEPYEFTLGDIRSSYKNTVTEDEDLPVMLAYGSAAYDNADVKDGLPLVAGKSDAGYDTAYGNDGGPIKLVIGQIDETDANKGKCIKNVTAIEVTASEQVSWNHSSSEIFKTYLNSTVEFKAIDTENNVLKEKTYTVAELEAMTDIISQEDIYATSLNTWEGLDFWKLIQRTFSDVSGIDNPITINVTAADGFAADAVEKVGLDGLRNGVKDGSNYVPVILAYAVDGYPLASGGKGAGAVTGEGYDSTIDNKGGPMRLMVHQAQGACLMEVVKVTVKVGEAAPVETPDFTVASNTLDKAREFSVSDLKALTATEKEYTVKGVTEKARGVLLKDLMDSLDIKDEDSTFKINAGTYDGEGTYTNISLADAIAQEYLVAYEEYVDGEWKAIDDTAKTPKSKVRIYRKYMEANPEADQTKWYNKCQYITGLTVSVPEKTEFDVYEGTGHEGDLPLSGIRSVQEDKDGNLWVATYGGGMAYRAKDSDQFVVYNYNSDPALLATIMTAAYPDNKGGVWFNQSGNYKTEGSSHGVAYMDSDKNITYYTTADDPQTVPHDYSYCMNIDKQGNVWIGTSVGITKYDPKANTWQSWTEGFPAKSVQTIEFDDNGGVWLGFYPDTEVDNKQYPYYGGFAYFKNGQIVKTYNIESDKQEDINLYRLQDVWVRDIAVDKNGGAWIIASGIRTGIGMNCIGGKVWYVSQPGADAVEYTGYGLFGEDAFSENSELRKVAVAPDGSLWFGTSGDGVFRVDDPTIKNGKLTLSAQYSRSTGSWSGESGSDNIWSLDFFGNTLYAGSATGVQAHEFEFEVPEPPTGDIGDKTAADCDIAFEGDALARNGYFSVKGLKNYEDINKVITSIHTLNMSETTKDVSVEGATLENIVNMIGLAEGAEIGSIEAVSSDGKTTTYTPEKAFNTDLEGHKAMYIWKEDGGNASKMVRGQFAADDINKGDWAKDVTKIIFRKKEEIKPAGDATEDTAELTITGSALARDGYFTIKGIKNTEGITKVDATFGWKNSEGQTGSSVVQGATLENIITYIGLANGAEVGNIDIISSDDRTTTYTADQALNTDIAGNKAMFIWKEGETKPSKVIRGQFSADDVNKGAWAKDVVKIVVNQKEESHAAQDVIDAINALPEIITVKDEEAIAAARAAYDALTDAEKAQVTNLDKLETAEKDLEEAIEHEEVLEIIDQSEAVIDAVDYSQYDSTKSIALWLNLSRLESRLYAAETVEEAQAIADLIAATIANTPTEIEEAQEAINDYPMELTAETGKDTIILSWDRNPKADAYEVFKAEAEDGDYAKIKVTAENTFTDKNVEIEKLYFYKVVPRTKVNGEFVYGDASNICSGKVVKELSQDVKDVIAAIDKLPGANKVVLTDEKAITAVRAAYDALIDTEKSEVTNLDKLEAVEAALENAKIENIVAKAEKTINAVDYSQYSATKAVVLMTALEKLDDKLKAATTVAEAEQLYKDVKNIIAATPTLVDETKAALNDYPIEIVAKAGSKSISLSWDETPKAESYKVLRATTKSGKYTQIKLSTGNTYTDSSVEVEKTYYYKVVPAAKVNGEFVYGDASNICSAKVKLAKSAITKLSAGTQKATITWKSIYGAEGYKISYKRGTTTKVKTVASATATKTVIKKLKSKKKYVFKVRAYKTVNDKKVYGQWSTTKTVTIK